MNEISNQRESLRYNDDVAHRYAMAMGIKAVEQKSGHSHRGATVNRTPVTVDDPCLAAKRNCSPSPSKQPVRSLDPLTQADRLMINVSTTLVSAADVIVGAAGVLVEGNIELKASTMARLTHVEKEISSIKQNITRLELDVSQDFRQ